MGSLTAGKPFYETLRHVRTVPLPLLGNPKALMEKFANRVLQLPTGHSFRQVIGILDEEANTLSAEAPDKPKKWHDLWCKLRAYRAGGPPTTPESYDDVKVKILCACVLPGGEIQEEFDVRDWKDDYAHPFEKECIPGHFLRYIDEISNLTNEHRNFRLSMSDGQKHMSKSISGDISDLAATAVDAANRLGIFEGTVVDVVELWAGVDGWHHWRIIHKKKGKKALKIYHSADSPGMSDDDWKALGIDYGFDTRVNSAAESKGAESISASPIKTHEQSKSSKPPSQSPTSSSGDAHGSAAKSAGGAAVNTKSHRSFLFKRKNSKALGDGKPSSQQSKSLVSKVAALFQGIKSSKSSGSEGKK